MISRRMLMGLSGAGVLVAAELWLGVLVGGCSDETGGERVTLATRAELEPAGGELVTSLGFHVELARVELSLAELRYFEGEPVTARRAPLLAIRQAWAHPGHYQTGGTVGEMLEPASFELTAGPVALPGGAGVTGVARSARVTFAAAQEWVVRVEGIARRDELERPFSALATGADVSSVEGCAFDHGRIDADGTVVLRVRPGIWLDQVDFSLVPESTDAAPVALAPGELPHKAFVRGLAKAAAYGFSFEEGGT